MVPVTAAQAQPTGSISGTVTDQANAGLGEICVAAYDWEIDAYQTATSTAGGTYTISGLPAGSYEVDFRDCGTEGTGYQPAVWGSVDGYSGTPVVLDTDTSAVNGIDVQLSLGGAISGTLAGAGNLEGACVQAVSYPGYWNSQTGWNQTVAMSDGSFLLRGLPAEPLHLKVEDCNAETPSFATTWFKNLPGGGNAAPAQADADPITVTTGEESQLPELAVSEPGSISGAVIDSATGEPVVGACVSAHSPNETPTSWGGTVDGGYATRAFTDEAGLYRLQGLAEGPWAILVEPCGASNFERTWLHGKAGLKTADLINVIAGQNTQIYGLGVENGGIPTVGGGSLSGTITAPDGTTPVERACVNAVPAGSASDSWGGEVAWTQADGTYTLQALAEGTYDIIIDNCPRFGWSSDWERPEYLARTFPGAVTITAANEDRVLDASFEMVGGVVSGRAVDDQGQPLSGVYVDAYDEVTGRLSGMDVTGTDGAFRIVGLPEGRYNVNLSPSPNSYALRQESGPHEVLMTNGALGETEVGDVAMVIGGRFTAHVVDSAGEPVTGLQLELAPTGGGDPLPAWFDHVPGDYHGHYRPTTVPANDYTLSFLQCNYVDETNPCPSVGDQPVSVMRATTTDLETLQLGVTRTRTTLTSSPNPSRDGEAVTLTATVTGPEGAGAPTGSVEFSLGNVWFHPVRLEGGVATLTTTMIPAGVRELSAHYSGDAIFANSTGYVSHTVEGAAGKALSVTTVTSSDPSSVQGETVTYTVQVAPSGAGTDVPTGTVQLFDGSTALTEPVALSGGQASIPVSNLAVGARNIVARYAGDEAFASSAGSTVQQVDAAEASVPTELALTVSPSQAETGSTVTFVATVVESDGSAPSGTVTFVEGDQALGMRLVESGTGTATYTTSTLPAGTHVVSAIYSGDALFQGSRSGDATVMVNAPTSTDGGGGSGGTGGGGGGGTGGTTDPAPSPEAVQVDVQPGGTASSDPSGTAEPTPTNPVIASVTSPNGGTVSFDKILGEPSPDGYTSLYAVAISAPAATVEDPLRLTFTIDSSVLPSMVPPEEVTLFRNGEAIVPCTTSDGTATPDPCVSVQTFDGDNLTITVLSSHASEWVAGLAPVVRVSGTNRVQTAVATSRGTFPEKRQAPAAVLARDDAYPDALVGGPLAVHKGGPLLLTDGQSLSDATRAELQRVLRPGATVYLLGGRAALGPNLHRQLQDLGHPVVRLAGEDRYATAVTVASRGLGNPDVVLEASGLGFADALSAAPAAAAEGAAILLTRGASQADATAEYLASRTGLTRYAVGGPAAGADPDAVEVAGDDRYGTSTAVAARFFAEPTQLAFASGTTFPDALAGGAAAGLAGAPLLLVPPAGELEPSVADYLHRAADTVGTSLLYGGPAAVSDGVLKELVRLLES